jgi:hypothetical protein
VIVDLYSEFDIMIIPEDASICVGMRPVDGMFGTNTQQMHPIVWFCL